MVTLYVDGDKVGEGRVEQTVSIVFGSDETVDVGCDKGTPATDDYGAELVPGRAARVGR